MRSIDLAIRIVAARTRAAPRWVVFVVALGFAAAGCGGDGGGVAPDREPPEIVALSPADGAVAVPVDASARIVFSEPVVIDSLAPPPLRAVGPDGPIDALVTLDSTATILTLAPVAPWPVGLDYELVLEAGIADRAGNMRPDSFLSRFSTGVAFEDIGRLFVANQAGHDITVLDARSYAEVEGSPVPLGPAPLGFSPLRLSSDADAGLVYVLYLTYTGGDGVLALDARTLEVVRDSGPVLPAGAADLAVAREQGLVVVAHPDEASLFVLDAATLAIARPAYRFDRADAAPMRLAISERFDLALVALDGGGLLAALRLPSLTMAPGFPAAAVDMPSGVAVDDERGYAWVTGSARFAIVDLINAGRTESFEAPVVRCSWCTPRLWGVTIAPHLGCAFLLYRRQALATVDLASFEVTSSALSSLGLGNVYLSDVVVNPRSGELIVLGWGNLDTPLYVADPLSLEALPATPPPAGDLAADMEILP